MMTFAIARGLEVLNSPQISLQMAASVSHEVAAYCYQDGVLHLVPIMAVMSMHARHCQDMQAALLHTTLITLRHGSLIWVLLNLLVYLIFE